MDTRRLLTITTGSSSLEATLYRLREDTTDIPKLRAEASRSGCRGGMRLVDERSETRATTYSKEQFEEPPEISNWTWTPCTRRQRS